MPARKKLFKACRNCYFLTSREAVECPNCGSKDLTEEWDGVIIVIKPEESRLARNIGISKQGRYALKVS
ncbi:MAG: transcription elongation factor subunit Spt4 [Desulfurococcaceae archaeon]|uniref:Transcription elongation factor Spt4 n=1 Tax=Staphylothermus marinus TaxID=2280 RepID=A0A7C4JL79_STAMA